MKKIFTSLIVLMTVIEIQAAQPDNITVYSTTKQHITGFGGACCDGAMKPFGSDYACVNTLYSKRGEIHLNILRMEISPSFEGEGWGDYNWNGSLPSAKVVKKHKGIVFGTPWSPPGEYKTNGTAQGGNAEDQGYQEGRLRKDCYELFFPWLNTFLGWMKSKGVAVDAVSIQNEPDWWVNYSGCLYTPEEEVELVKNYAHLLDRETHNGVKLISGEPLGYTKEYIEPLMKDPTCREQIDIVAGHLYGHLPLKYMKPATQLATQYGKEVWMTEHSVSDNIRRLPTWRENLQFAEELNECMLAGCTAYIYWYLRAHWAFVGTGKPLEYEEGGEKKEITIPGNKKDELLPRAFVMSHFSRNVTGSTRLATSKDNTTGRYKEEVLVNYEYSAYQKGDSLIVMAINTTKDSRGLNVKLPYNVKSGSHWLSTDNESDKLCQISNIDIPESTDQILVEMPAESLNTFIFMIDKGSTAIENVKGAVEDGPKTYYDLHGRRMDNPHGLCIERSANGESRKVMM